MSKDLHDPTDSLNSLSDTFSKHAKAMKDAVVLIGNLSETVDKQAKEIEQLKLQLSQKNKMPVTFLLDGSGSMRGTLTRIALEVVKDIAATHKNTQLIVYGDKKPHTVNIHDENSMEAAAKGLNINGDLWPTLDAILAHPPKGKHHYVILSDGDLVSRHDKEHGLRELSAIRTKHPKIRVSAVLLSHANGSHMQKVLHSIPVDYSIIVMPSAETVAATVKDQIAKAAASKKQKVVAAPKA